MNLDEMTRSDMKAACKDLRIKGMSDKDKPTIRLALEAYEATVPKEDAEDVAPATPVTGAPLTSEQRAKLRNAKVEQIREALEDSGMPTVWRDEFQAELDARSRLGKAEASRVKLTTKIEKFVITKGGPFALPGRRTQLHAGGVISALTHDLAAVRAQGIEVRPLEGRVVVSTNEMGRPITTIVEARKPHQEPQGDAPTPGG